MIIGAKGKQQLGPWTGGEKDRLRSWKPVGRSQGKRMTGKIEFKSTTSHCSKTPYKGQSQRQATPTEKALKQKAMRITVSALRLQRQKAISPTAQPSRNSVCVF